MVGIDLVQVKDLTGAVTYWINCVCWGSSFQLVGLLEGDGTRTAENTWCVFVRTWVRVFVMPEVLVVDPGGEFQW